MTTEWTDQKIFDTVLFALRKQGKASVDDGDSCMYRAPDGCKCAAGHLIPDDKYDPSFEGNGIYSPEVASALPFPVENGSDREHLLLVLQRAHDTQLRNYGVRYWEGCMSEIATESGLHYTPAE